MTYTFETLPIEDKELLRQRILELFDRDIATVPCAFSTRNYVFIFSSGCFPSIIRVGKENPSHKAADILSELVWVDDLKNDIERVCQPLPSLGNRLVESITIGETVYLATMFRKANGAVLPDTKWTNDHFYNAGALLGKIHRTSSEAYQRGFRYKRGHWYESIYYQFTNFGEYFPPPAEEDARAVVEKIKSLPRDPSWYGMIHGDFQNGNLFSDWGDLWAFDFDDCCLGFFMFDIVCLVHIFISSRSFLQKSTTTPQPLTVTYKTVLEQVRAGYSSEYQLPDEQWDMFDDFFRLRTAQILGIHTVIKTYSKDIFHAIIEPTLEYLKFDRSPIDRMQETRAQTGSRLTPEQIKEITALVMG